METDATNPVDVEDTAAATLDDATGVDTDGSVNDDSLFDEDGNPIEGPPEDEEIELEDGLKLKVSKDYAEKLRLGFLRQQDYTKKTQGLSDERKAFEAERDQVRSATQEELNAYARAVTIGEQIAAYQNVNWAAELAQARANYDDDAVANINAQFMQFTQLERQQQAALAHLSNARQQRLSAAQQETAKRIDEGRTSLAKEIGWNDDLKAKLLGFAGEFGFSREELDDLEADPRVAKVLHAAFEGREATRKAKAAQKHVDAQQAQPAATVRANRAPPSGVDDRQNIDAWMKARNEQLRKRG